MGNDGISHKRTKVLLTGPGTLVKRLRLRLVTAGPTFQETERPACRIMWTALIILNKRHLSLLKRYDSVM